MKRQFDNKLFLENDKISREKVIKYIPEAYPHENKYDFDLRIDHDYFHGIEIERIKLWKNNHYMPFKNETRLFERKLKYTDRILFIQLSNDLKKCCVFTRQAVDTDNYYTTIHGDKSYRINKGAVLMIDTNKLNYQLLDILQYLN